MLDPKSTVRCITIEASKESKAAGEYVIDLAEYSETEAAEKTVAYFQLKHTTVRQGKRLTLTELKNTFAGFSKRYSACFINHRSTLKHAAVTFSLITNRSLSTRLKKGVQTISGGATTTKRLQKDLQRITKLKGDYLRKFCASLSLVDSEGDYIVQKERLHGELADYIAGFIDSEEVNKLIALVADRALPKSEDNRTNGEIYPEDVLKRLGVTSRRELFPAPPEFEKLPRMIRREQHAHLLNCILSASGPIIIHAEGGVGKSVVAQQLAGSLLNGSRGFVYDCFGGGKYRNQSEPRHRPCDALLQIANEMATAGLCHPLIGHAGVPPDAIFRSFLQRLKQASDCVREINKQALIVLFIDAADNAEMAASEGGDKCFASALLREPVPETCRLVVFSRTERVHLLRPPTSATEIALLPFSKVETADHLRRAYPEASDKDCLEFHRLTGGNPRVQGNALAAQSRSLEQVLAGLGPSGTTVNDQIAEQLRSAVSALKDRNTPNFSAQVDSICQGLANLPPFIPLEVLARAAGVDISTIKSFVSDLGRPLWHSDDAVQFRDEPTETWFRQKFGATKPQIAAYVSALESLATKYTYVAKVLPQLLLKCENYDRLVDLALSNDYLPENNPIDERDIRVYRLQFAFKAALKLGRIADAARLAFRAGEEVAGDKRQMELLQANSDLIAPLQDPHRVQELAYRQAFRCSWPGSENVYSAALLSSVKDFQGEARSYLRAARKWLQIYFEDRDARAKANDRHACHQEQLQEEDLAILAWSYHNLYGAPDAVRFLASWRPPHLVFRVTRLFVRRLIDAARFDEIAEIASIRVKTPYLMLAVADELLAVGRFPSKESLRHALDLLVRGEPKISKPHVPPYQDTITAAIISLAEASSFRGLSPRMIQEVLEKYTPAVADGSVTSDLQNEARRTLFRGVALRSVIAGNIKPDVAALLPKKNDKDKKHYTDDDNERELTQIIAALLPWHIVRARLLVRDPTVKAADINEVRTQVESVCESRYRTYDRIPYEVSRVRFEVLALNTNATSSELQDFDKQILAKADSKFALADRFEAGRAAFRLEHLTALRPPLEQSCVNLIAETGTEGPEERATWFMQLARAVLPQSQADAAAYFAQAVEAVSKFGDEMVERWEALVAVAKKAAESQKSVSELAYRFVRCAEVIGETVVREKYWDRDDVFRVAVRLDAPNAFAALSRWRDRGVGWFGEQLHALATESVERGLISPLLGWCLSGFEGCYHSAEYAALCMGRESERENQQRILNAAIRDCELDNTSVESWKTLQSVADKLHLEKGRLPRLVAAYAREEPADPLALNGLTPPRHPDASPKAFTWDSLFQGVDLLTPEGLSKAHVSLHKLEPPWEFEKFWREVIRRTPVGKESLFLQALIATEGIDLFDFGTVAGYVRAHWLMKAAIKRFWPGFLRAVGKRFALEMSSQSRLDFWLQQYSLSGEAVVLVQEGVFQGLAESPELGDASSFFGFVRNIANSLTVDEAFALLEFSLTRFEKHFPSDAGDGPWSAALTTTGGASDAVTGLIWSALGSPHSAMRWQAAHCVRRLAEYSRHTEIASLVGWMQQAQVGSFGSHRFPFYALHAKLYLLIALARAAVEDPATLRACLKSQLFSQTA